MATSEQGQDSLVHIRFKAEDGHADAMFLLGIAYAQGRGVDRDDTTAAYWFLNASKKGHVRAHATIGYLYATGRGARHDCVLGYIFLARAAKLGDPLGKDLMIKVRRSMSPSQLATAERFLEADRPSHVRSAS